MTDAASPFLNLPLRTEREAQAARERQRRLDHHGAAFCRRILDGAYERVDQPDGGYRLREVVTGRWIDDKTLAGETSADGASASEATSLATASQTDARGQAPLRRLRFLQPRLPPVDWAIKQHCATSHTGFPPRSSNRGCMPKPWLL